MESWSKATRVFLQWRHFLAGWPIGVFVYTPIGEDEAFVLLTQVAFVPAVVLTGMWMWQQAHVRRLYRCLGWWSEAGTAKDLRLPGGG